MELKELQRHFPQGLKSNDLKNLKIVLLILMTRSRALIYILFSRRKHTPRVKSCEGWTDWCGWNAHGNRWTNTLLRRYGFDSCSGCEFHNFWTICLNPLCLISPIIFHSWFCRSKVLCGAEGEVWWGFIYGFTIETSVFGNFWFTDLWYYFLDSCLI